MVDTRGKMIRACPMGSNWPHLDARCNEGEIRRMVQQEIARLSWVNGDLRGVAAAFPGASTEGVVLDGFSTSDSPTTYPPLADRFRGTDDYLIQHFKSEDKPKPVVVDEPNKPLSREDLARMLNRPAVNMAAQPPVDPNGRRLTPDEVAAMVHRPPVKMG
jgi:hypothetical protein